MLPNQGLEESKKVLAFVVIRRIWTYLNASCNNVCTVFNGPFERLNEALYYRSLGTYTLDDGQSKHIWRKPDNLANCTIGEVGFDTSDNHHLGTDPQK